MSKKIFTNLQEACWLAGIEAPTAIVTTGTVASNEAARKLYAITNRALETLASTPWPSTTKAAYIKLVSGQQFYSVPTDFLGVLPESMWAKADSWRIGNPTTAQYEQFLNWGTATDPIRQKYRVAGLNNLIKVYPVPSSSDNNTYLTYYYKSSSYLYAADLSANDTAAVQWATGLTTGAGATVVWNGNYYTRSSGATSALSLSPTTAVQSQSLSGTDLFIYLSNTGATTVYYGISTTSITPTTELAAGATAWVKRSNLSTTTPEYLYYKSTGAGTLVVGAPPMVTGSSTTTDLGTVWAFTAGKDYYYDDNYYSVFADELLIKELKWRIQEAVGKDFSMAKMEAEGSRHSVYADLLGYGPIDMAKGSGEGSFKLVGVENIPDRVEGV